MEGVSTACVKYGDYCWVEIRLACDTGRLLMMLAAGRTQRERQDGGKELVFGGAKLEMACRRKW